MTMQASTLGILEAADFTPKQARALAQAIEGEIKGSDLLTAPALDARNFVTVPILDARNFVTEPALDARNFVTVPILDARNYVTVPILDARKYVTESTLDARNYVTVPILDARKYVTESTLDARNYVDVPTLDARLGELKLQLRLELAQLENRLFNKMTAMGLSLAGLSLTAVFFMILNLKR